MLLVVAFIAAAYALYQLIGGGIGTTNSAIVAGDTTEMEAEAKIAGAEDKNAHAREVGEVQAVAAVENARNPQLACRLHNAAGAVAAAAERPGVGPAAVFAGAEGSLAGFQPTGGGGGGQLDGGGGGDGVGRIFTPVSFPEQRTASIFNELCGNNGGMVAGFFPPGFFPDGNRGIVGGQECRADPELKLLRYDQIWPMNMDFSPAADDNAGVANFQRMSLHASLAVGFMRTPAQLNLAQMSSDAGKEHIVRMMTNASRASYGLAALKMSAKEIDAGTDELDREVFVLSQQLAAGAAVGRGDIEARVDALEGCTSERCLLDYLARGSTLANPDFMAELAGMTTNDALVRTVQLAAVRNMLLYKILERERLDTEIAGVQLVAEIERDMQSGGGGGGAGGGGGGVIAAGNPDQLADLTKVYMAPKMKAEAELQRKRLRARLDRLYPGMDALTRTASRERPPALEPVVLTIPPKPVDPVTLQVAQGQWQKTWSSLPGWEDALVPVVSPADDHAQQ